MLPIVTLKVCDPNSRSYEARGHVHIRGERDTIEGDYRTLRDVAMTT